MKTQANKLTLRSNSSTSELISPCFRRSPRLSSTCTEINGAFSGELALTLHTISYEEEPVPLQIYDPKLFGENENCMRRSTRFTTNKYSSSASQVAKEHLAQTSLRRRSTDGSTLDHSQQNLVQKALPKLTESTLDSEPSPVAKALPQISLRRSPRFSHSTLESQQSPVPKALPQMCLRSSPKSEIEWQVSREKRRRSVLKTESTDEQGLKKVRTCLGMSDDEKRLLLPSGNGENGNAKCESLAKSLIWYGKTEFSLIEKEEIEVKSAVMKTPVKNMSTLGNIELSSKCLRSRKIPIVVVGHEIVENKLVITEDPVSGNNEAPATRSKTRGSFDNKEKKQKNSSFFVGDPVPEDETRERWQWRYELKSQRREGQGWILNADEEDEVHLNVECHYLQANVDGCIYNLGDCANIKGTGKQNHVGRILEFFKTMEGEDYFRVQWFFRAEDTVMKEAAAFHDKRRLFSSTLMNDNLLDCIISKVDVIEIASGLGLQSNSVQQSKFYYDMEYSVQYSTFRTLLTALDNPLARCGLSTPSAIDTYGMTIPTTPLDFFSRESYKAELALLDLYAGCGGMSTGLCLGAKLSGVNLVTRWAIDYHKSACDSLKLNHPETQVRHTTAEDFLELLKEWEKLCNSYVLHDSEGMLQSSSEGTGKSRSNISPSDVKIAAGEYEVSYLVDICYGDPTRSGKHGLKFKVRWKGYGPSDDTWEPIEGLSNCQGHIQDFVRRGLESKILPVPGDVDVICGGPPCQGISGYNRYRHTDDPLADERNQQIVVFMDMVKFLKPKYVLMENVVDILRFDKASLGRYAISRLVHMKYQARLGIMAAGCYGLPQFRFRVFLWGALPHEKLPQFPLPTHDVIVKNWCPPEFEQNTVAYDEGQPRELEEAVVLRDAISDLPAVTTHEAREEMTYLIPPETEFQKYIRSTKDEIFGSASKGVADSKSSVLYDHRPYQLSEDDYLRVCHVPRRKGANFRDFPGILVDVDNVVRRDPKKEPVLLPSGKSLVPDYVFTFEKGKSKRPFARLWWDETVGTVVTFPSLHNQATLHPDQDRVLTVREYARLQGFPDCYRFCGTVKERYCQVGNAVSIPVAKALGYSLGMAFQKLGGDVPLMILPPKFSFQTSQNEEIVSLS